MARESRLRFSGSGLHSLPRWKVAQAPMRFALRLSIEEVGREGPREALHRSTTESEMPLSIIDQIVAICGHKQTLSPQISGKSGLAELLKDINSQFLGQAKSRNSLLPRVQAMLCGC